MRPTGNIFLTNIHRVYAGDDIPASPDDEDTMDYFPCVEGVVKNAPYRRRGEQSSASDEVASGVGETMHVPGAEPLVVEPRG